VMACTKSNNAVHHKEENGFKQHMMAGACRNITAHIFNNSLSPCF